MAFRPAISTRKRRLLTAALAVAAGLLAGGSQAASFGPILNSTSESGIVRIHDDGYGYRRRGDDRGWGGREHGWDRHWGRGAERHGWGHHHHDWGRHHHHHGGYRGYDRY